MCIRDSLLPIDTFAAELGNAGRMAVLSGPTHAEEVICRKPSAAVVASADEGTALFFRDLFATRFFRTYTSDDPVGVELCLSLIHISIRAVEALGAEVDLKAQPDGSLSGTVTGWGAEGPSQPAAPIDCGNSGTTARLLMGIVAPWDIEVTITGDESLQKRPMRRIVAPLALSLIHI